jgi:hypothetical protein
MVRGLNHTGTLAYDGNLMVVQFGLGREIRSERDPSLRRKSGCAQDDTAVKIDKRKSTAYNS